MTFRLLVAICTLSILFSCGKDSKQGILIPKNASVAVIVNGAAMSDKLPWEEVKKNEMFKKLYADSSLEAYLKTAMENPDNTGIDTKKELIFYMMKDSSGGYIVFKGDLKDLEKFKNFNSSLLKGKMISSGDQNNIENGKVMAVWNKEHFAIIIDAPELNNKSYNDANEVRGKRNLTAASLDILSLKKSNTLAGDKRFQTMMEEKSDVAIWMNMEEINRGSEAMAALSMMNMNKFYEGSVTTARVNFENGKIELDAISYASKEMTDIVKKYGGSSFDKEMIRRIPSENVAMFFAMNFKPEGLKELVKLMGMEGMINMGTAMAGFTIDDFVKAIKGDLLFTMNMNTDSNGRPKPDFIFASSINDKSSFEKLINAGKKMGARSNDMEMAYFSNGKYFAIGNKKPMIDQYFSGNPTTDKAFMKDIKSGSITAYADFQSLLKSIPMQSDTFERMQMNASLKVWDKMIMNGGDMTNKGTHQHVEVSMMDKNTNSLKQLNEYLSIMSAYEDQKKTYRDSLYAE